MAHDRVFSVLLEFQQSKRVITVPDTVIPPADLVYILETELKKVDQEIKIVLGYGSQSSSCLGEHLLQRYSKEWQEFVDVIDVIEIDRGDHLRVVPVPKSSAVPSKEKQVSILYIFCWYILSHEEEAFR